MTRPGSFRMFLSPSRSAFRSRFQTTIWLSVLNSELTVFGFENEKFPLLRGWTQSPHRRVHRRWIYMQFSSAVCRRLRGEQWEGRLRGKTKGEESGRKTVRGREPCWNRRICRERRPGEERRNHEELIHRQYSCRRILIPESAGHGKRPRQTMTSSHSRNR